jgi:hypothetical protein
MRIYQDGQRSAQEVGKNLKDPIFAQVFVDLATGLAEAMRRRGDEVESKQSLNLLYRATDQVGPRSLLQYGSLSPKALAGLLFWRKWLFDIDNRAGQETGYVFEPIIAYAIGGVPASASKSPVRRSDNKVKGRQVDCVLDQKAYEMKIRVTIAASSQGRWREELEFPQDCQTSGYIPVLLVLDPTPNPKLHELSTTFQAAGGEVYIGQDAWNHLTTQAGATMSRFLELYVHEPIQTLL